MEVKIVIPTYNRPEGVKRCVESIPRRREYSVYIIPNKTGWIEEMNKAAASCKEDTLIYAADDIEFCEGAIEIATQALYEHFPDGDGLVGFNQSNIPDGIDCAFGIMGRKFLSRFPHRWPFCPDYKHHYSDMELGQYAKS